MVTITTKYIGPSAYKGSRISANDGCGNYKIVSYKSALSATENHKRALLALAKKLGISDTIYIGDNLHRNIQIVAMVWVPLEFSIRVEIPNNGVG